MRQKIKLLVAGRQGLMLNGFSAILNNTDSHEVAGTASNGIELFEKYFQLNPDVILSDIYIPELNGFQAINQIRQRDPGVKAILHTDDGSEEIIFYAAKSGAKGLIDKKTSLPELIYTLLQVHQGKTYYGDEWNDEKLKCLMENFEKHHCPVYTKEANLTAAELEVMMLLFSGLPAKKIAEVLHKSKKTVDNQLYHIKKKLNARNMAELFKYFNLLHPEAAQKIHLRLTPRT